MAFLSSIITIRTIVAPFKLPVRAPACLLQAMFCGGLLFVNQANSTAIQDPPDFEALEQAGAVVGKIYINPQNIFDLTNDAENNAFFRWVNRLHIPTRAPVIERVLLFKSGDRVSRQKIDETERLLRASNTRYDVYIKPVTYEHGVVDIEVTTRDTWTLNLTGSYSRAGGNNKTSFGIVEQNLLGTGLSVGYAKTADLDRKGSEFDVSITQLIDGWTNLNFLRGRFNDGSHTALSIDRPFYALDTRWAARADWREADRIVAIYNAGNVVSEYRHQIQSVELSGGWSPGLINGWVRRYSAGTLVNDNTYRGEPGRMAPLPLPIDNKLRAVFFRMDLLEDAFVKVKNYNRIERAEYLALGFNSYAQLTAPVTAIGASRSDILFSAAAKNGYQFARNRVVLASAAFERRIATNGRPMTQAGFSLKFYAPQAERSLLYASVGADRINGGGIADQLMIGGQLGLRGYPTRYQAGEQRLLMSIEKRAFTDWYPFRLLRVGGAVFFDSGRAWGGPNQNKVNGGQLSDVGIGLRIALDRTAFANMLHADLAAPLNRASGIKPLQFLLKSEFSF